MHHLCSITCSLSNQLLRTGFSLLFPLGSIFCSHDSQELETRTVKISSKPVALAVKEQEKTGAEARLNSALQKSWQSRRMTTKSGYSLPNYLTAHGTRQAGLLPEKCGRN